MSDTSASPGGPLNAAKVREPDYAVGPTSYNPLDDPGAADGWLGQLEEALGAPVAQDLQGGSDA